ncbi:hypothetical protein ACHAXN_001199 [Cyclotella atomus]
MPDDHDLRHDHHIHNHIDGLLHHHDDGSGVARTSTGVADPLANLEGEDESIIAAQNVVDATVGAVVGVGMEDEEALRAGEEAAAAAMEAAASAEEAAALAEEAVGAVFDDHDDNHGNFDEDDEIALAAAAAAAAVQADGISVVVDQALLATAAAAAASQVASGVYENDPTEQELHHHHEAYYGHHHHHDPTQYHQPHHHSMKSDDEHGDPHDLLEQRRIKDRKRYAGMSDAQRSAYNAHRRELYHKQGDEARKRRRERERSRYHSLEGEHKKDRNARRAKLERDRYNKLSKEELELRNARRRERARQKKLAAARQASEEAGQYVNHGGNMVHESQMNLPFLPEQAESGVKMEHYLGQHSHHHNEDHHEQQEDHIGDMVSDDAMIADAVTAAAEVAEEAFGAIMDDSAVAAAMDAVQGAGQNEHIDV